MTPSDFAAFLANVKEAGASECDVEFGPAGEIAMAKVKFDPKLPPFAQGMLRKAPEPPEPLTPFLDAGGKPVDLDEGAPEIADESALDRIHRKNFPTIPPSRA